MNVEVPKKVAGRTYVTVDTQTGMIMAPGYCKHISKAHPRRREAIKSWLAESEYRKITVWRRFAVDSGDNP